MEEFWEILYIKCYSLFFYHALRFRSRKCFLDYEVLQLWSIRVLVPYLVGRAVRPVGDIIHILESGVLAKVFFEYYSGVVKR